MPFADSPVPLLKTTINVDKYYHRHNGSLHALNPLVGQMYWEKCRPSVMKRRCSKQSPIGKVNKAEARAEEWRDTYDLVCNFDGSCLASTPRALNISSTTCTGPSAGGGANIKKHLTEEQRLSIALIMCYGGDHLNGTTGTTIPIAGSGSRHDDYVFAPSHLVYNELSMILQTRYFRLISSGKASNMSQQKIGGVELMSVREIDLEEYNSW